MKPIVVGLHAIQELVKHKSDRLQRIYALTQENAKDRKTNLLEACKKKQIPISYVSFDILTKMAGGDSHQGLIAEVNPREYFSSKEFLQQLEDKANSIVLMLDQIFDPQNLGAILRAAECFGVDGVIFSKNRGTEITPVTTKTSCGASELVPLIRVSNLAETVTEFQKAGYSAVVSLLNSNAQSLFDFKRPDKILLVLGSEGDGVQPLICKRADASVYIPMKGAIQSLNVASACAVFLSHFTIR